MKPGCVGKVKHHDRAAARKALASIKRHGGVARDGKRAAYRCASCGAWHIGSKTF